MDKLLYLDEYFYSAELNIDIEIDNFSLKFAPFIYLVSQWSQILGLLLYKCKDHSLRKNIVLNLYDENCGEVTHVDTFYRFLVECGYKEYTGNDNKFYGIHATDLVKRYMENIETYIMHYSFEDACAILGSIEYVYHLISQKINDSYRKKFDVQPNNHYTVHDILDINHANLLFDCASANGGHIDKIHLEIGAAWIIGIFKEMLV